MRAQFSWVPFLSIQYYFLEKRFKKTDSEDTDELEFGCEMCTFTTKDDVAFSKHLETHETEERVSLHYLHTG